MPVTRMLEHMGEVLGASFGSVLNDATISAALSAVGSSKATLLIGSGNWTIANNLIIPANVRFKLAADATITINSARTLTLNGPYDLHGPGGFAGAGGVRINYTGQPVPIAEVATAGAGTAVSPWTGWLGTLNNLPQECVIDLRPGWYDSLGEMLIKKRQTMRGAGSLHTHIRVPNGSRGIVGDLDLDYSGLRLSDFHLFGTSTATLDLITLQDFIGVRISRVHLDVTGGNGIRALHGTHLKIYDCEINNCAGSFAYLGGLDVDQWVNAYTIQDLRCANAPGGIAAANGGLRLEQTNYGMHINYTAELDAGGKGVVLDNCGDLTFINAFIEHGDGACFEFGSTTPCRKIDINTSHLHNTLGLGVDATAGNLVHRDITIWGNQFVGYGSPLNIRFRPGATQTYDFYGNRSSEAEADVGLWVEGHPNTTREVELPDGVPVHVNGLAVENAAVTITSPTGNDLELKTDGTGPVSLISGEGTLEVGDGQITATGTFSHIGDGVGINGQSPRTLAQMTITGSRGNNAALTDLLAKLALAGYIVNNTTA